MIRCFRYHSSCRGNFFSRSSWKKASRFLEILKEMFSDTILLNVSWMLMLFKTSLFRFCSKCFQNFILEEMSSGYCWLTKVFYVVFQDKGIVSSDLILRKTTQYEQLVAKSSPQVHQKTLSKKSSSKSLRSKSPASHSPGTMKYCK